MVESQGEFPINFAKLHHLPVDTWRALLIFSKVRHEINMRGNRSPADEFAIENELPEVIKLRQEISSPIVLLIPFVLHPLADCLGRISGTVKNVLSDPYDSEKYQRFEG